MDYFAHSDKKNFILNYHDVNNMNSYVFVIQKRVGSTMIM